MTLATSDESQIDSEAARSQTEKILDKSFFWVTRLLAIAVAGVLLWMAIQVAIDAIPAIQEFGLQFLIKSAWNPVESVYGVLPMILGASNFQTILQVVLPSAMGAIITGTTLAIARAAGETAPLIFTALFSKFWPTSIWEPVPTLSVLVYKFATVPYENQQEIAWAASLILVLLVLITSILSRLATLKSTY